MWTFKDGTYSIYNCVHEVFRVVSFELGLNVEVEEIRCTLNRAALLSEHENHNWCIHDVETRPVWTSPVITYDEFMEKVKSSIHHWWSTCDLKQFLAISVSRGIFAEQQDKFVVKIGVLKKT